MINLDVKNDNTASPSITDKKIDVVDEKRNIFKGPYVEKMRVLKAGNFRLNGILYNMRPNEFIDGSLLTPQKKEILINTKFISYEGGK